MMAKVEKATGRAAHVEGLVLLDADAHPVQHHDGGEPPRLLELPLPQL